MNDDTYIWINRWEDFQHYPPRRDRGPAWIKSYSAQLDDERYWRLSNRQRALLHDLRHMFATMRARLPHDRRMIEARRQAETRHADLQALNQAGFIIVCSRQELDQRLDNLYASRVPAHSQEEEVEKEVHKESRAVTEANYDSNSPRIDHEQVQELSPERILDLSPDEILRLTPELRRF